MSVETVSQLADFIDQVARAPQQAMRDTVLGHKESLEELAEVWNDCRHPGWDGYDGIAVEQDTLRNAYMLIESLPLGFPRPSIGAEPDGQLTLEWRKSSRRVLSVSVDPDGYLHYAGLYGPGRRYGTLPFYSTAPRELLELVRDL